MSAPAAIVDVHCHLTSAAFAEDLAEVLARARAAGIERLIAVGETPADNRAVLALAAAHPGVLPALGHYPEHLDEAWALESEALLRANRDRVVAIGEVGIDHRIALGGPERERQHALFRRFVRLGLELDLPLSVHSRSAGHHAIAILEHEGARRVCLHAFDGKAGHARRAADMGFYLSVPPSIVRSRQKQKLVAAVPLERLLLESDAPVLGPDPGARNEPATIAGSLEAIAGIKGVPATEVRSACLRAARELFGAGLGL